MTDKELQVSEKQPVPAEEGEFTREGVYFTPAVDICETEKELMILADMPGVSPEGVDIEIREGILTIEGKVAARAEEAENLLTEYRQGNYFRNFRVTDTVDSDKIEASMSNGVLKVVLPKAEKAMPRKVAITTG